ncbi:MAG: hypothetical protein COU08_00145 [Candidatus Harrisonbacteria bacterium CG10_big_fil_rev_8_21_14_0_10_42_17]|uniref:Uncharacterized protein n=1 Tax=Candidatus Harrisonbacteria bacterium CG10_big_fil_rev_8_21_14_0_10_42_17 TaxID=1974584 RepID=A0A2M6WJ92_9BACT|nr:MAG: hypothetical protein COU08_00145 [Candidatus Harrisonbacteria bacterium CG10_big_fil_rev_8_21_14_0_10_42_17]
MLEIALTIVALVFAIALFHREASAIDEQERQAQCLVHEVLSDGTPRTLAMLMRTLRERGNATRRQSIENALTILVLDEKIAKEEYILIRSSPGKTINIFTINH